MSFENYNHYPNNNKGDVDGVCTVGFGHKIKGGEDFSAGLTLAQAYDLLLNDLSDVGNQINRYVSAPLDQQQFDALSSYVFNVGVMYSLENTQFINHLNHYNYCDASLQMDIIKSGVGILPGLIERRNSEQTIWNYGIYLNHH